MGECFVLQPLPPLATAVFNEEPGIVKMLLHFVLIVYFLQPLRGPFKKTDTKVTISFPAPTMAQGRTFCLLVLPRLGLGAGQGHRHAVGLDLCSDPEQQQ